MPYVISPLSKNSSGLSNMPEHHTFTYLPLRDAIVPPSAVLRRPKQASLADNSVTSKSGLMFLPAAMSLRPIATGSSDGVLIASGQINFMPHHFALSSHICASNPVPIPR